METMSYLDISYLIDVEQVDGDTWPQDGFHQCQRYQVTSIGWIIGTATVREGHVARYDEGYDERHDDNNDTALTGKESLDRIIHHGQTFDNGQAEDP